MTTISITLFKNHLASLGETRSTTWKEFSRELKHKSGPKDGLAFTCGTFVGNVRKAQNAQTRTLISMDVEQLKSTRTDEIGNQPPSVNVLADRLKKLGWSAVIYTTYSHKSDAPRYRVVLQFDKTFSFASAENHQQALGHDRSLTLIVAEKLGIADCVDPSKFGIASLFYSPRCDEVNLGIAQVEVIDGRPLVTEKLLKLAAEYAEEKWSKKQKHAETVAKIAVANRSSKNTEGSSLIDRLRPLLPSLTEALGSAGYIFYSSGNRWLSPHSQSGIAGVAVINCSDGIARAYIHHASDPLCGANEIFGVKAHDSIDIIIATRFGISDEDFQRGLGVLAQEYGLDRTHWGPFGELAPNKEQLNNDNDGQNTSAAYNWPDPLPFIDPPPLNWSTLKYVLFQRGGSHPCLENVISLKR